MNNQDGQVLTHQVYEDPDVVDYYIQRNSINPQQAENIKIFSESLNGNKVLDLGCGPGHDSYVFAELGFAVTGLDFSSEMIKRAKKLKEVEVKPKFMVGDMRRLVEYFDENTFNAVWANASLLHIRLEDIDDVIKGITRVCKNGAKVAIRLKGGDDRSVIVKENKYKKETVREFTVWSKQGFLSRTEKFNWKLDRYFENEGSSFMGKPTNWLNFYFEIRK